MSDASFPTTQWTALVSAKDAAATLVLRQAREQLCLRYWRPLYFYARARGQKAADAEDLVQGFLIRMMEGDRFLAADRSRGRFRSYLLTAFQHFMTEEWRREGAQKRGGGESLISLDFDDIEERVKQLPAEEPPELVFDRAWAKTLVAESMQALEEKWAGGDRAPVFAALKPHLALSSAESLVSIAERLGRKESTLRMSLKRIREDYRLLIREHVAATLLPDSDLNEEIRYLIELLVR
jgi:DNA-directed RNA polymerase specialized sigma24 family protein